jgi:ribosomal protein S18 acetylase RimI-like enzyme
MDFPLTSQMIDKIIFAMEDQKAKYAVHVASGELVPVGAPEGAPEGALAGPVPDERYVLLPRWGSAEGFHLMESFVTTLHNPLHREALAGALASGKGVFRGFKDALKRNPEIEKLWFHYKEKRLRAVVVSWYNASREARGLEMLAPEPEETGDLVASDFTFSWGAGGRKAEILRLDRDAFYELFPTDDPARLAARYGEKRQDAPAPGSEASPVLVAEDPDGGLAGFAWGRIEGQTVHILQLAVAADMRGIGLGEAVLRKFLIDMRARGMKRLTTELAGRSLRYAGLFRSVGFHPVTQLLECSLDELPF